METLEITNFLTIRQAKLDVRRITILIGPQANGKSIVAKLLYFFRNFLTSQFIKSIENQETKRQLQKQSISNFEQIFPRYAWTDQTFKIVYRIDEVEISLSRQGQSTKKSNPQFDYSSNLAETQRKAKSNFRHGLEEPKNIKEPLGMRQYEVFRDVLRECIYNAPIGNAFQNSVFIPASRSFFANLQKNVFSFLANNIAIDPLIKEFGSVYELSKKSYDRRLILSKDKKLMALREEVKQELEKIIAGEYVYEDDQDWIISGKKKINLANASSGQQEALPLLVVIYRRLYFGGSARPLTFFIEEPEAHLFPVSQRRLVGIFSRLYKSFNYNFVLTTHSPYVLTALNNLIMASNLIQEKGPDTESQVGKVIGKDAPIKYEDVNAYTIQNGSLESILDSKSNLIGSSIIDSVSDEFDRVFGKLMEIELQ
jgi:AAA15 family ATPase/GTPase